MLNKVRNRGGLLTTFSHTAQSRYVVSAKWQCFCQTGRQTNRKDPAADKRKRPVPLVVASLTDKNPLPKLPRPAGCCQFAFDLKRKPRHANFILLLVIHNHAASMRQLKQQFWCQWQTPISVPLSPHKATWAAHVVCPHAAQENRHVL